MTKCPDCGEEHNDDGEHINVLDVMVKHKQRIAACSAECQVAFHKAIETRLTGFPQFEVGIAIAGVMVNNTLAILHQMFHNGFDANEIHMVYQIFMGGLTKSYSAAQESDWKHEGMHAVQVRDLGSVDTPDKIEALAESLTAVTRH